MSKIGLQSPISVLNLGTKPRNALCRLGVSTIGEFLLVDVSQVTHLEGVGQGTATILRELQEDVSRLTDNSSDSLDGVASDYAELWKLLKKRLSVRTRNGLNALAIKSLNEFMGLDRETFLSARSIGETSWKEVKHLQKRLTQMELSASDKYPLSKSLNNDQVLSFDEKAALEMVRKSLRTRAHLLEDLNITDFSQLKAITPDDVFAIPGAGKIAWEKLKDSIILAEKACEHNTCSMKSYTTLADFPLWNGKPKINVDIPEKFFPHRPIKNIANAPRCKEALNALNLKTIGDTLLVNPEVFLKLPNFGISSLEALRSDIQDYIEYQSKANKEEWQTNSFADFLFFLCENANISEDHILIVIERLTGKNNSPCTLDEIASQYGFTRERVRQIIKTTFTKINNNYRNRYAIERLRVILKDVVINSGGIISIEETMPHLVREMGWKTVVSSDTFSEYLKYIPIDHSLKFDGQRFLIKYPCRNCESLSNNFAESIEIDCNGQISFVQLEESVSSLCIPAFNDECPHRNHNFSREFWCEQANKLGLTYDAENIYTNKMWQLQNGGLPRKVEAILHAAQSSMKPDELTHILNKELGEEYSTKKVHAALINSPECVVWGRGEFIHSSRIISSDEIIEYISVILADKLSAVPFIASKGIYDEFRTTFMSNGIPNEYALSSLINLHLERFHVDRYRYIYPEKPENSTSIDDHIEQWILDAGEAVKRCDLEKWLIDEIGTRKSLVNLALNRIDSIIPEKKGWLVHIDNLGINKINLMPLCEYIDKELDRFTQLGVNKILKNNQVYLAHLKIHNARMLYAILQYFCSDKYNFPRFPHIGLLGQDTSMSLGQELSNYVHKRGSVVTAEECVEYFEKKGYSAVQTRARIGGMSQLLEYYPRCIVHENTLGWNSEKIHILKDILIDSYNERISSGYLSGDLDEVFEIYEEQLPSLNNGISWTGRLLASVSGQIEEVILLGNAKRAYLLNGYSLCPFANLGDLVCHVVRNHFSGGCSRADLNQWMVDNGIVKKQLTSQMFSPPKGLVLTEYECYWEGK